LQQKIDYYVKFPSIDTLGREVANEVVRIEPPADVVDKAANHDDLLIRLPIDVDNNTK